MSAIGGSIESISLDGRNFSCPDDADFALDLGGNVNEVLPNGDSTARLKQNKKPWMFDGGTISIDTEAGDMEFLQDLADSKRFFPVVITLPNEDVYQGSGQIVDELKFNNQNASASLSLAGEGKLTKQ